MEAQSWFGAACQPLAWENRFVLTKPYTKNSTQKILSADIKQLAKKLKMGSLVFQQDNDPEHTAENVNEWFLKSCINTFK